MLVDELSLVIKYYVVFQMVCSRTIMPFCRRQMNGADAAASSANKKNKGKQTWKNLAETCLKCRNTNPLAFLFNEDFIREQILWSLFASLAEYILLRTLPSSDQCTGMPDFSRYTIPKREKYSKHPSNMYTKWPQNILNSCKIAQTDIKYTNVFRYKTLQNWPK
jgi:hypothetical protein